MDPVTPIPELIATPADPVHAPSDNTSDTKLTTDPSLDTGLQRVYIQVIAGAGIMTLTADANAVNAIFESSLHAWPDAPPELFKFAAQVKTLTQTSA